jgi:hypothetical protein
MQVVTGMQAVCSLEGMMMQCSAVQCESAVNRLYAAVLSLQAGILQYVMSIIILLLCCFTATAAGGTDFPTFWCRSWCAAWLQRVNHLLF